MLVTLSAMLAAKAVTTTVPIVFAAGGDPIRDGLVTSLNRAQLTDQDSDDRDHYRPRAVNVTGVNFFAGVGRTSWSCSAVVPNATTIGMLVNPNAPNHEAERKDVQDAARMVGQQVVRFRTRQRG